MNRFFKKTRKITKKDFSEIGLDIDLSGIDSNFEINDLATLESSRPGDLTFFTTSLVSGDKYLEPLKKTNASYVLIKKEYKKNVPDNVKPIFTSDPYIAFIRLYRKIVEETKILNDSEIAKSAKISDKAVIGKGVKIGENVIIEDFAKICDGAEIGDGSVVKSFVVVGRKCKIGKNCILREFCSVQYTEMDDESVIYSGARIGNDGFGFVRSRSTNKQEKIDHYGFVKIGKSVEIGANACIDRGTYGATEIDDDVKLDNLVQIGHNVKIHEGTVIAGQSGVAGSAEIGKFCNMGGKTGIAGHIKLGDYCNVAGASQVSKSFPEKSTVIGIPAEQAREWMKNRIITNKIIKIISKLAGVDGKKKNNEIIKPEGLMAKIKEKLNFKNKIKRYFVKKLKKMFI